MENISLDNVRENFSFRAEDVQINGSRSKQGVANFLGIPYAQFPARFRTAGRVDLGLLDGQLDASRYGPRCPQKTDNIHPMMHHMFEKLSMSQSLWVLRSTPDCRCLYGYTDDNHLVRRSMDLGRPIVIVTLNYRLNVFGFLSSREIIQEAKPLGEVPILNQGLNDQRIGLEWIQKSIHHFGGDASNVTLSGESAGAASVCCYLKGGHALFHQALIQSSPKPRLRSLEEAQATFDQLVESAGIAKDASDAEKLARLRALSAGRLVELFDGSVSLPIEDPNWFELTTSWDSVPQWCSRIIMGHTKDEAALFLTPFQNLPDAVLAEHVRKLAPELAGEALFSGGHDALQTLTEWATEETFVRPTMDMLSDAAEQGTTVYAYEISVVDPFPGPLHGYAWHSFGVPLTFYEPSARVYPQIKATQDKMSEAYVAFFHGLEPWEAFNVAKRKMCWDGEQTRLVDCSVVETRDKEDKTPDLPCRTSAEAGMGIIAAALKMQTS
ncbi:hypothetical protein AYO21_06141 [Fonsecaea monophora]|uniref:Carboxylic ester hydrolase n=1 Tax=Fonsecaea monophora TaxID=254056 RepID=A0A177F642_9EURO|nr:hypothetical protein AYO21_06141 [Fonsecaea monophora]OAG39673.1 hypothetical protein AYO21_06141 [Fonsecaea monophora]